MALINRVQEEVLRGLGRLSVTARQAVETLLAGQHRGLRRGLSVDFAGHRAYQPGDDLRHLDWQVWARSDRDAVRVYDEETRLRAQLLLDVSASMAYGTGGANKLAYARLLCAVIATLLIWQGDPVALALLDTELHPVVPAGDQFAHLARLLQVLEATHCAGDSDLPAALETFGLQVRRRGLVVLLSDGGRDLETLASALRRLRRRRQELLVFLVEHPDEAAFPFTGQLRLVDRERPLQQVVDADRLAPLYRGARSSAVRAFRASCHQAGIHCCPCRSDEDIQAVLIRGLEAFRL